MIKELCDFYENGKKIVNLICFVIWLALIEVFSFFTDTFLSLMENEFAKKVVTELFSIIGPTAIIIIVYFKILKFINTDLWKMVYPQYDFNGQWSDLTIYTKSVDKSGWHDLNDTQIPSPIIIKQTCLTMDVEPSVGEQFEWHSLAAKWKDNKLIILYEVNYYNGAQRKGFPEKRIGYESMVVCKHDSKTNKPIEMQGRFHHCISNDGSPIYMGDVTYTRSLA